MNGQLYYLRYVKDAILQREDLSLEERGALDLIYDHVVYRGAPLGFDDRLWARKANTMPAKWRKICDSLRDKGLLCVDQEHGLYAPAAIEMVEKIREQRKKYSENGAKGGVKRAQNAAGMHKNNELAQAELKHRARDSIPKSQYPITSNTEDLGGKVEIFRELERDIWTEIERLRGSSLPERNGRWWVPDHEYETAKTIVDARSS